MRKLAELYIKVYIIVQKGATGLHKGFFWARSSISAELSVGKIDYFTDEV